MPRRLTAIGAAVAIAMIAWPALTAAATPPRVTSLNYFVRDDGTLPHTRLMVSVRRADRVRLTTVFEGERAGGSPTLDHRISGRPWVLKHQGAGGELYGLIRRSLARRGSADVRIRARNEAGRVRVKLRIRESECTKDPPFYPLDCTVHS